MANFLEKNEVSSKLQVESNFEILKMSSFIV